MFIKVKYDLDEYDSQKNRYQGTVYVCMIVCVYVCWISFKPNTVFLK